MLKFLNRDKDMKEREFRISITSVQGGAQIELDMIENGVATLENVLLTPMDAAFFINQTERSEYMACAPVGHGPDGKVLVIYKHIMPSEEWYFVGQPGECNICVGDRFSAIVPAFVVEAMAITLEQMMPSLMYPTTGDVEEEFG